MVTGTVDGEWMTRFESCRSAAWRLALPFASELRAAEVATGVTGMSPLKGTLAGPFFALMMNEIGVEKRN